MGAYLVAKKSLLFEKTANKALLSYISEQYQTSEEFKQLAPKTQKEHINNSKMILSYPIRINKKSATLADLDISDLTKPLMNAIREKRLKKYIKAGKKGVASINRQTSYLHTAIKWGLNTIPELPAISNPLEGIKKFRETPNTRYVTDQEMEIQCKLSAEVRDYLPTVIRLSYLLGTRGVETIALKYSDLIDDGIVVSRKKRSKDNIIKWSSALREEVKKAKKLTRKTNSTPIDPYLITNSRGLPLTQSALQSAMRKLRKHMIKQGAGDQFFTLHKTKSKAQSDSKDSDISGLTSAMIDRYNTKKKLIDTGLK